MKVILYNKRNQKGIIIRIISAKQLKRIDEYLEEKVKEVPNVEKSSGKKKGQSRISKRGRRKLRRTMYESARALMIWNLAFQDVFLYYRNRTKNPLGGMQAKIAVACKAIRIFFLKAFLCKIYKKV